MKPCTTPLRRLRIQAGMGTLLAAALLAVSAMPARAATFTVTNREDSGPGSLRAAISAANGSPGSTIQFNIPTGLALDGVLIISPKTALPVITANGTIIDGTTQTTFGGNTSPGGPEVGISGTLAPSPTSGLTVQASNCVIRGLAVYGFQGSAIQLTTSLAHHNTIEGCYLGLNGSGGVHANVKNGVAVKGGDDNTIGGATVAKRNVICTNFDAGILFEQCEDNKVLGNYIGVFPDGLASPGYQNHGVKIVNAIGNVIGGTTAAARNVISGNSDSGVFITGLGSNANVVSANYVGTDKSGSAAVPNGFNGVRIDGGAQDNTVGGSTAGHRNVISGNGKSGVVLSAKWNLVQGNSIGLNAPGKAALPNGGAGVEVTGIGAFQNEIGGEAGTRNVISGNKGAGVLLNGSGAQENVVRRNFIGTNAAGTTAVPNEGAGVTVAGGATKNVIGGNNPERRNVISGNAQTGVTLTDTDTKMNQVLGNWIGINVNGTAKLQNGGEAGVRITAGAGENVIGGTDAGSRNVISGNFRSGVLLEGYDTDYNKVQGNFIGLSPSGEAWMSNGVYHHLDQYAGVLIRKGAKYNLIGGDTAGARNVISGNGRYNLQVDKWNTDYNVIQGNYIGTNKSGTAAFPQYDGVLLMGGRFTSLLGNLISGNQTGVTIYADDNTVKGNRIGTNAAGTLPLKNAGPGIHISGGNRNIIGGTALGGGEGNVIAYNIISGIRVSGDGAGNSIRGNSIYDNEQRGIGLETPYGVPPAPDNHDADTGPNGMQNYPTVSNVVGTSSSTAFTVNLHSTPGKWFYVDIYANPAADPSGYGEGKVYVGSVMVKTNAQGNVSHNLSAGGNYLGQYLTATATRVETGDTSDFGPAVKVE